MTGIYKITNPKGRVYVGQSINIKNRWNYYRLYFKYSNQPKLINSFLKYGIESHIFEVIEECLVSQLNERERYWQDHYNVCSKNNLNCKLQHSNDKSGKLSKDVIKKISESNKCKKVSIETKEKLRIMNLGKKYPPRSSEYKKFMSELRKGDKNPMFGKKIKESSKEKQREKLCGSKNYLYKPILNLQTGIYYDTLLEAAKTIGIDRRLLHQYLTGKVKINKTSFTYG